MIKLFNSKEEALKQLPLFVLKKFTVKEKELAIVLTNSGIKVFDNACPHEGASLAGGEVLVTDVVICPWHQYHFDLKTGACSDFECGALKLYEVSETDEGVFITVD